MVSLKRVPELFWSDAELRGLIRDLQPNMTDAEFARITLDLVRDGVLRRVHCGSVRGFTVGILGISVSEMGHGGGH